MRCTLSCLRLLQADPGLGNSPPGALLAWCEGLRYAGQRRACTHIPWCTSPTGEGGAMTFEELLDQVLDMLQRRGRVSYRAVQRQFDLDDATLEDVKAELLYAHPELVADEGRGLVWTGAAGLTHLLTANPPETTPQPAANVVLLRARAQDAVPLTYT